MGLQALIGVVDASGAYQARDVQLDGCPTVIVPVLTHVIHDIHDGDVTAAVGQLMRHHWRRLHMLPATFGHRPQLVAQPTGDRREPSLGRIDLTPARDYEWTYLFTDQDLNLHLGVDTDTGVRVWQPWARWPATDLPHLDGEELLTVQRDGYAAQWRALERRRYAQARQERFAGDGR